MRFIGLFIGLAGAVSATTVCAQSVETLDGMRPAALAPTSPPAIRPSSRLLDQAVFANRASLRAARVREAWHADETGRIRYSVETSGINLTPNGERVPRPIDGLTEDPVSLNVTRDWTAVSGQAGELEFDITPHAGIGVSEDGNSAEAGATVRIGENLTVQDGEAFGEQTRWYLFAAGSGRAVGLNFLRNRDGGWDRSGMSHDEGAFIGDTQVGVALRRGDVQASFGYVHREISIDDARGGGYDASHSEGLVAFQLSIRPD